jgi:hypothetical protein
MMLIFELWLFVDDCCDDDDGGEDYDYDLDERFAHARFVDAWARDNQSLNRKVFIKSNTFCLSYPIQKNCAIY